MRMRERERDRQRERETERERQRETESLPNIKVALRIDDTVSSMQRMFEESH